MGFDKFGPPYAPQQYCIQIRQLTQCALRVRLLVLLCDLARCSLVAACPNMCLQRGRVCPRWCTGSPGWGSASGCCICSTLAVASGSAHGSCEVLAHIGEESGPLGCSGEGCVCDAPAAVGKASTFRPPCYAEFVARIILWRAVYAHHVPHTPWSHGNGRKLRVRGWVLFSGDRRAGAVAGRERGNRW